MFDTIGLLTLGIQVITVILAVSLVKILLIRFLGYKLEGEVVGFKERDKTNYPIINFEYNGQDKKLVHAFGLSIRSGKYDLGEKLSIFYWASFPTSIYIKKDNTIISLLLLLAIQLLLIAILRS